MSDFCKVAWTEGMFLHPQHFQQQERYLTYQSRQGIKSIAPNCWGIRKLAVDPAALLESQFGLTEIDAVLPDGLILVAPSAEILPSPIKVNRVVRDKKVYLAAASDLTHAKTISSEDEKAVTRFHFKDHQVTDISIGIEANEILQLAGLSCELKLEGEDLAGYVAMPIAKILEVSEEGKLILDDTYIPPCLNYKASCNLSRMLDEIIAMLHQRGDAIAERLKQGQAGSSTIVDFLVLQLINKSEPLLRGIRELESYHPQELALALMELAGELATYYTDQKRSPEFSKYKHDDLGSLFGDLEVLLSQTLSTVFEQTAVNLSLEKTKFGIHAASIPDKSMLRHSAFVLAVKADVDSETLRKQLPMQLKIGPVEHIRDLINNQLPGIGASVLPVAPRQVPYHAGYHYFELDKSNNYWPKLSASGGIAIHLSGDFPELDIQLWSIAD
ncbi:type VI secretion system baseplate subunit TssK [Corallincola platygyrae]|uniref:Type VI secretion system baseplate subunit TssK n=1 Tax=Corallincola platygyrae TaxID=1193278 RepID=A0ABW4XMU8_9GAMM